MNVIEGDLIELTLNGKFDVIVHGCNCFCQMNAGIAKSIKDAFPEVYEVDLTTIIADPEKLGQISSVSVIRNNHKTTIINAYTQFDTQDNKVNINYQALRSCFALIKKAYSGKKIAYPMIGAGLASGDWNKISSIIDEELKDEFHTLVKLPEA